MVLVKGDIFARGGGEYFRFSRMVHRVDITYEKYPEKNFCSSWKRDSFMGVIEKDQYCAKNYKLYFILNAPLIFSPSITTLVNADVLLD